MWKIENIIKYTRGAAVSISCDLEQMQVNEALRPSLGRAGGGGVCIALVWISNTAILHSEAMSLPIFSEHSFAGGLR